MFVPISPKLKNQNPDSAVHLDQVPNFHCAPQTSGIYPPTTLLR